MGSPYLPAKNTLNIADAREIEDAFQSRLAVELKESGEPDQLSPTVIPSINAEQTQRSISKLGTTSIAKTHLPIPSRAAFVTVIT